MNCGPRSALDRLQDAAGPASTSRTATAATPDDCAVIGTWLRAMPEAGCTAHLLRRLRRAQPELPGCGAPEYDWLRRQTRTEHRGLLYGLLALRPSLPPPLRDALADGLTGQRAQCPRRGQGDEPGWLATLCAANRDGGARRRDR